MWEYLLYIFVPLIGFYQANFIRVCIDFLIRLVLRIVTISNKSLSRGIDKFLIDTCNDNLINFGNNKTPMITWHFRWFHGPLFIVKNDCGEYEGNSFCYIYILYGSYKGIDNLIKQVENIDEDFNDEVKQEEEVINRKNNKIDVAYFDSYSPYSSNFTRRKIYPPSSIPFDSQDEISDLIANEYMDRINKPFCDQPKKRVGALLLGKHGVGKSDTAKFVLTKLGNYGINPLIVYGYDMTAPGVSMNDVWGIHASKENPVIIVFNEFDKACEHADKNESNLKGLRSLAQNKTAMDDLLDRLECEPYFIMILTSNREYDYFSKNYPAFIRQGRIDYAFTMSQKKVIAHPLISEI